MAAPIGNQFWKLRLKHGRDRVIQSPEELWENACEYFEWCDGNPLYSKDWKGKDAMEVDVPLRRVYQKGSFAICCGLSGWEKISDLKDVSDDFRDVVARIEQIIASQKFEGAAVDQFNARIIAQDLGLNVQRLVVDTQRKTIDELFPTEEELNEPGN